MAVGEKNAGLYSGLLQALKEEHSLALSSELGIGVWVEVEGGRGVNFCVRSSPQWVTSGANQQTMISGFKKKLSAT